MRVILNYRAMAKTKKTNKKAEALEAADPSKIIVESYQLTTARNAAGIYGQRLMLRIAEAAQEELRGIHPSDGQRVQVQPELYGGRELTMPMAAVMNAGDTNHTAVRAAIQKLQKTLISYEPAPDEWVSFPFLGTTRIAKGYIITRVEKELWQCFLDFSKGFRAYELEKALDLKRVASVRLYKLMSQQRQPITFTIADLRAMFGIPANKYKRNPDFIARVIAPAKAELDELAPYSFDFEAIRASKEGRGNPEKREITAIRFTPIYQPAKSGQGAEEKAVISRLRTWDLPQEAKNSLKNDYGYTYQEYNNNRKLFDAARDAGDLADFLRRIKPRALRAANPKGYVIRALRKHLREVHHTTV